MTELIHALGIDWHILVAQIINFAILLAVLAKFVYKPVMRILDDRREGVLKALAREEKAEERLATAETDKERIVAEARVTATALIEVAKKDAEDIKKKLLSGAKEEIAKMRAEAEKKMRDDRTRLMSEVKGEIGMVIVDTIEKTLGDVLDARAQGKMVEQALAVIREGSGKAK